MPTKNAVNITNQPAPHGWTWQTASGRTWRTGPDGRGLYSVDGHTATPCAGSHFFHLPRERRAAIAALRQSGWVLAHARSWYIYVRYFAMPEYLIGPYDNQIDALRAADAAHRLPNPYMSVIDETRAATFGIAPWRTLPAELEAPATPEELRELIDFYRQHPDLLPTETTP